MSRWRSKGPIKPYLGLFKTNCWPDYLGFSRPDGFLNKKPCVQGCSALPRFFKDFAQTNLTRSTKTHIFIFAFFLGCFQGGIQAISRSLFARLVPKGKEGEFFGFYNMLGKFSAVIGPTLLSYITLLTGNVRIGLLSIVILFVGGGLIFYRVDFDEGERIAKEFSN